MNIPSYMRTNEKNIAAILTVAIVAMTCMIPGPRAHAARGVEEVFANFDTLADAMKRAGKAIQSAIDGQNASFTEVKKAGKALAQPGINATEAARIRQEMNLAIQKMEVSGSI